MQHGSNWPAAERLQFVPLRAVLVMPVFNYRVLPAAYTVASESERRDPPLRLHLRSTRCYSPARADFFFVLFCMMTATIDTKDGPARA